MRQFTSLVLMMSMLLLPSLGLRAQQENTQIEYLIVPPTVDTLEKAQPSAPSWLNRLELRGMATANYRNYIRYDLDPYQKDQIDLERFKFEFRYKLYRWLWFEAEMEFEHGGTGTAMEFDALEEAGEFEQEVEQGGEVKLEELFLEATLHPYLNVRLGRVKVYVGLAQQLSDPMKYSTVLASPMEHALIPCSWYETGVQLFGGFLDNTLRYTLTLSSGLDASGFSSRNWIRGGYQVRFERPIAEAFAVSGRLNYHFGPGQHSYMGLAAYTGNTTPNRPKQDILDAKGRVWIAEGHFLWDGYAFRAMASGLYGHLADADIISYKNKNLSNALGVKRTPVGTAALGAYGELAFDLLYYVPRNYGMRLFLFGRYDYFDSMFEVTHPVHKNGDWQRQMATCGINWQFLSHAVLKLEYMHKWRGSEHVDRETMQDLGHRAQDQIFSAGLGVSF